MKMPQCIVMSPCYEILRYGHDKIKNQVEDAHKQGKLAKFVIGVQDLIDLIKIQLLIISNLNCVNLKL